MRTTKTIITALLIICIQSQAMNRSQRLSEKIGMYGECAYKYPKEISEASIKNTMSGILLGVTCLINIIYSFDENFDWQELFFFNCTAPFTLVPIIGYELHQFVTQKALFHAIEDGDGPLIKRLLDYNIDPDITKGKYQTTPLMYAAQYKRTHAIELLMNHHADILLHDENGETAYDYAPDVITCERIKECQQKHQFTQSYGNPALALRNREIGHK